MHAFLADQQAHAGSDNKTEALSRHFDGELCAQSEIAPALHSVGKAGATVPRLGAVTPPLGHMFISCRIFVTKYYKLCFWSKINQGLTFPEMHWLRQGLSLVRLAIHTGSLNRPVSCISATRVARKAQF